MGGACSPFIHCLVQPFIPCMLLEGRGRRTKLWILISHLLFCRLLIFKSEQQQKLLIDIIFCNLTSQCEEWVYWGGGSVQLFVYIAMHCAIHIVVFLFFYVWCLSKCTTCNRCIVRGEGGGVWAFIEVVEPSVMSWVSRPLPVVRLTGWFSDLLAFFLLPFFFFLLSGGTTVGKQYCG